MGGQDGWILVKFSETKVHKNAKKEGDHYQAILTGLAWSIMDLLYGISRCFVLLLFCLLIFVGRGIVLKLINIFAFILVDTLVFLFSSST